MAIHIQGMGTISPQKTWGEPALLSDPRDYSGDRLSCVEPDYTDFLDVRQLRRMSRILRLGVAAATLALRESGIMVPDGIITGTSYGCLEDTGIFLAKMIENGETALNPTPFIQSTHNTIGSQIALLLQCQGYNQTYTQRAFSFENALLDALMALKENPGQSLLVGGVDEITDVSHTILRRFRIFRNGSTSSLKLFENHGQGTLHGEGASYFVLSGAGAAQTGVSIEAVATLYKPDPAVLKRRIEQFLESASLQAHDIDLLLMGTSGDKKSDALAEQTSSSLFTGCTAGRFKHLCGEYPTASAFALWLATRVMQTQQIPPLVVHRNAGRPFHRVLIYNPYFGNHHSLILLHHAEQQNG